MTLMASRHGFLASATRVSYSRDAQWVAWIDGKSRLWRAKSDGSERVLVTPPSMQVFAASWSTDDAQLAFMARTSHQPWQVFKVRGDGGVPERLIQEDRNLGDPTFSADGKSLAFGTIPELMSKNDTSSYIGLLDLTTRKLTRLSHSDGLYSPSWSPDGRYIAALTLAQKNLVLYDTRSGTWQQLSSVPADHPTWTRDSQAILFRAFAMDQKPICRIDIHDRTIRQIADLRNFRAGSITLAEFSGVTPQDVPLMHTETSSGNLSTMNLN